MKLKIILNEIKDRKGRFFTIVFCLALSMGMLITSWGLLSQLKDGFKSMQTAYSGNSDLVLSISDEEWQNNTTDQFLEYSISEQTIPVNYDRDNKIIRLVELSDLSLAKIVDINDSIRLRENEILVSSKWLKASSLSVGDTVPLNMGGATVKVRISGTFQVLNQFTENMYDDYFFSTKKSMLSSRNKVMGSTNFFLKVKNPDNLDKVFRILMNEYGSDKVKKSFDEEKFTEKFSGVFTMLFLVSIAILIMSISIIYSTKKFMIFMDANQYAVIRSVGGNQGYIRSLLLIDGLVYGVFGGGVSLIFSKFLSSTLLKIITDDFVNIEIRLSNIIFVIVLSIVISCTINMIASKEIRKQSIKDILIRQDKEMKYKNKKNFVLWLIFLCINIIFTIVFARKLSTNFVVIFILISIVCFVGLIPFFVKIIMKIVKKGIQATVGNIGYIVVEDIKVNKSFKNNVTIIAIAISLVLLINAALYSSSQSNIKTLQEEFKYDLIIPEQTTSFETISAMSEVSESYKQTDINNVDIDETEVSIYSIDFVKKGYDDFRIHDISSSLYDELYKSDAKIVLSKKILSKLPNKKIGDHIKLDIMGNVVEFKIIGSFITSINNGDFAVASYKKLNFYTEAYFKLTDKNKSDNVVEEIKNKAENSILIYTHQEYINKLVSSSSNIYDTIQYVSILPIIVSFVILLTNGIFSFYENKRNLVILSTMGMSNKNVKRIFLFEQNLSSVIGCSLGVIFGNLLIEQVKIFMIFSDNTLTIDQSFIISSLFLLLPILFSSLSLRLMSYYLFRRNFVEDLRN